MDGRGPQIGILEEALGRVIERVREVRDDGRDAGRREREGENSRRIRFESGALFGAFGAREFMAAFAETKEQSEQGGAGDHVAGDGGVRAKPTGKYAQDEPERDASNIEVSDLFEAKRIRDVEGEIGKSNGDELWRSKHCAAEGDEKQADEESSRHRNGDLTAGDGSMAFDRMNSIRGGVDEIVQGVNGAGQEAKHAESTDRAFDDGRMSQVFGEDDRCNDERVLHPLVGTNRADHAAYAPKQAAFAGRRQKRRGL